MLLLGKHVESITSADILRLVEEGIPESRSLDYKRDLLGNRDKDKKEFLADVSSFANTGGGVIIFGIDEQRDEDGGNTGVPFRILGIGDTSPDEAIRRMDNIIRDGLDPVLDGGVIIRGVPIGDDTVLVVGIPRSVMAPHMVIFKNHGRFYGRASAGRFQMDVRQLRSSFLRFDEWFGKAEHFRAARVTAITSGDIYPTLSSQAQLFLHFVPLGSGRESVDIRTDNAAIKRLVRPLHMNGSNSRPNLDGYLVCPGGRENRWFIQFFRDGSYEVCISLRKFMREHMGKAFLSGDDIEDVALGHADNYVKLMSELGILPPFAFFMTLTGVRGRKIKENSARTFLPDDAIDRECLVLDLLIADEDIRDIDSRMLLKPAFDMLWQAGGWLGSPNYD